VVNGERGRGGRAERRAARRIAYGHVEGLRPFVGRVVGDGDVDSLVDCIAVGKHDGLTRDCGVIAARRGRAVAGVEGDRDRAVRAARARDGDGDLAVAFAAAIGRTTQLDAAVVGRHVVVRDRADALIVHHRAHRAIEVDEEGLVRFYVG